MAGLYWQRVLCVAALVSLLHCAYSAAQHRAYLRLTEQPFHRLPVDILVQTLVSLLLVCYSAAHVAGDFQPIRADLQLQKKSFETVGTCMSFITFDHRAKALSPYFSVDAQRRYLF